MKKTYINILTFALLLSFSGSLASCGEQVSTPTSEYPIKTAWTGKAYSGPLAPKMYLGNTNDFYIEELDGDIHVKISQDEWKQVTNISNLPYVYNLWNLDINYEGYFMVDDNKTDVLVKNHLKENILENTLELKDDNASMTKLVDARNPILLMGNFKKHAKLTQYNELLVEEISVYTDNVGALQFGTYNFKTKEYVRTYLTTVGKGLNEIKLNTYVGYNETFVIGGDESNVSLYACSEIKDDNQYGLFTQNKETLNVSSDRLILKVKAKVKSEKSSFPNISIYESEDLSKYTLINYQGVPVILKDYEKFENKRISKFKFPIDRVTSLSDKYTLTVSILKQNYLTDNNLSANTVKEYPLDLTPYLGDVKEGTLAKWIEIDVTNLNITLKDGEMLGFAKNTDNVLLCIDRNVHNNELTEFNFYLPYYRPTIFTQNVFLDIYTLETSSLEDHLENLSKIEYSYLFKGKNISIFGDSISSFKGYSNDTSKNSTIGNNGTHYSGSNCGVTDVNQTWWMRLINKTETNLIVNNSSAGDAMNGQGLNRCVQLHNNEGVNPDIICMFFGINDVWRTTGTLEMFKTNYVTMLNKMKTKYPSATIYASTYLPYTWWSGSDRETVYHKTESELEVYNTFVRDTISKTENVYLVDLARDSGITFDNYKSYCADEGNRWLHPNASGMELIANTYYNAMVNR